MLWTFFEYSIGLVKKTMAMSLFQVESSNSGCSSIRSIGWTDPPAVLFVDPIRIRIFLAGMSMPDARTQWAAVSRLFWPIIVPPQ